MLRRYSTTSFCCCCSFFFFFSNRLNPLSTEFILRVLCLLINAFKNHVQIVMMPAMDVVSWPRVFRLLKTNDNTMLINMYNLNMNLYHNRCTV